MLDHLIINKLFLSVPRPRLASSRHQDVTAGIAFQRALIGQGDFVDRELMGRARLRLWPVAAIADVASQEHVFVPRPRCDI